MKTVQPTIEELKLARDETLLIRDLVRASLGLVPAQRANPQATWAALVEKHEAAGLSRAAAILAAAHEQPELYQQQSVPKAQFRARR